MNSFEKSNDQGDLSQLPVIVSGLGFDLFYKAKESSYGYQGELEKIYL